MTRILIIPSATEIALEVYEALYRRRDVELLGAESTDNSHAGFVFRDNFRIPDFNTTDFIPALNGLIRDYDVDYVFPAHDDVQLALRSAENDLACPVLSSPLETLQVTCFKSRTYELLRQDIPVPALYVADALCDGDFPVFVKPDRGQGSQHTYICRTRPELDVVLAHENDMLICEYLPGREVTVDCFSDRAVGLLFVDARLRGRTRAGISVRSEPIVVPEAGNYAKFINERLDFFGAWFFQLKERSPDEWVLLEIGARIPGGATYQRLRGVNLPLLTLFEHQRKPVQIRLQPFSLIMDRAFISRFRFELNFDTLYLDFDDTFELKGEPNSELIGLVALARHRGKTIVLLSRNAGGCRAWLEALGLENLFDEIRLIDRDVPKSRFIRPGGLLIDDSFIERRDCLDAGVLCVDVDAVPAVMDQLKRG